MVNTAESGIVSLNGRGFAKHPRGNYSPGEFASLINCELDNGSIRKRPGCTIPYNGINNPVPMPKAAKFIGHVGDSAFFAASYQTASWNGAGSAYGSQGRVYALEQAGNSSGQRGYAAMRDPDLESSKIYNPDGSLWLDTSTVGDIWNPASVEGIFHYNGKIYWIHAGVVDSAAPLKHSGLVCITRPKASAWAGRVDDDTASAVAFYTSGDYESIIINDVDVAALPIVKGIQNAGSANGLPVLNHFVHKDRVWVVLGNKLLFSKATDPWEWRVSQDGGFISFADARITYALPKDDGIYIFTDSTVDYFTYTNSPNTDGQLTRISHNLGAHTAVEHENEIYFPRHDALYHIRGTVVEKVMDLYTGIDDGDYGRWEIVSYYNYLIINFYLFWSAGVSSATDPTNYKYKNGYSVQKYSFPFINGQDDPDFQKGATTFFINTTNGSMYQFRYNPLASSYDLSSVASMYVVSSGVVQTLWFECYDAGNPALFVYLENNVEPDDIDTLGSDYYVDAITPVVGATPFREPFYTEFIVKNFAPEGLEYNFKKYRNLMVEATLPQPSFMNVDWNLDDRLDGDASRSNIMPPNFTSEPPEGYRIGINGRGRAMSMRFRQNIGAPINRHVANVTSDPDLYAPLWEIFDIRVYWTYSGRAPY